MKCQLVIPGSAPYQGRSNYELKKCLKKEWCKQCRHVKLKYTMAKRPVHKKTQNTTTTKHVEHQDPTDIQVFLCVIFINCIKDIMIIS